MPEKIYAHEWVYLGEGAGTWEHEDYPKATTYRRHDLAQAEIDRLREALRKIANGEGVYGQQAHEYKQIARAALENSDE